MKISLIHPSRARPKQALLAAEEWRFKSSYMNEVEYILSLDKDDCQDHTINALFCERFGRLIRNNNRSIVDAVNNAAKNATGDLLVVMSDDFLCPKNWDKELVRIAEEEEPGFVIKTEDGSGGWICTLPIVDRTWYERFGYIYYPHYRHMFCDTDLTSMAWYMDRLIETDLLFSHEHWTKTGKKDEVSEKANSTWNQGQQLYIERYIMNFGLKNEEIKQNFKYSTHKGHLHWLVQNGCPI